MSEKEFINGSDPDANEQWAALIYNDKESREGIIRKLEIKFLTTGDIVFNMLQAQELINFMANQSNGIEWEPDSTEQDRMQVATTVVSHLFDMIVEGGNYLAKFSMN